MAQLELDKVERRMNELSTLEEALHQADAAYYDGQTSNFLLGGVLLKMRLHNWFGQYDSFEVLVNNRYSMGLNKARALISIYQWIMSERIQWEDVAHLGWVKLSLLVGTMTAANMREWRTYAEDMNVHDLRAFIRGDSVDTTQRKTFHLTDKELNFVNKRIHKMMNTRARMTESQALVEIIREFDKLKKELA